MELTQTQEMLIEGLGLFGVHQDQVVGIMVSMKDNEEGMVELMNYMADNKPTAHEIIKKSIELVMDN